MSQDSVESSCGNKTPPDVPDTDDVIRIATNMRVHGGSFAQALGRAMIVADSTNLRKIVQTWPELISKYASTSWR